MGGRRTLALTLALGLAGGFPALAQMPGQPHTDLENPALRDLPLPRGPIVGGKRIQPTREQLLEREQLRRESGAGLAGLPPPAIAAPARPGDGAADELRERILRQSERPLPRVLLPE